MEKTIYWAILLDKDAQQELKHHIRPKHPNVFAEHVTLAFQPDAETEKAFMERLGEDVTITVVSVHNDEKCQAVGVFSFDVDRVSPGPTHITISCAEGTKPVYSNKLIESDLEKGLLCSISPFDLTGKIARYTRSGWKINE